MFEGLAKTQPEIAQQLSDLVSSSNFPSSSLFFGPSFSGRMYAAMQLSLALDVPKENTIIVSDRNHEYRIKTALTLLKRAKNKVAKDFLKENIGILLQQYHGALIEDQSAAGKKRFDDAAGVGELLDQLGSADETQIDGLVDKIAKAVGPLMDTNKTGAISVGQVRAIRDWCSTSAMDGQHKLIIIEGLENALSSAVNALLKTLEEPPRDTYFVIISANPGRLLATILSRVRKFKFNALNDMQTKYILNSLFVDPKKYGSLEQFFLDGAGIDDAYLIKAAEDLVVRKSLDVPALVKVLEENRAWDLYYSHVIDLIHKGLRDGSIEAKKGEYLLTELTSMLNKAKTYNQLKRLTFDYVVYRTKEVLR